MTYDSDQPVDLLDGSTEILLSDLSDSVLGVLVLAEQRLSAIVRQPRIILSQKRKTNKQKSE